MGWRWKLANLWGAVLHRLGFRVWEFDDEPPDDPTAPLHVYPVNDLVGHELEGDECVCGPHSEPVKRDDGSIGWMVVHEALDGRD